MADCGSRRGKGNLPTEVTSFVGRRRETFQARRTLGDARLLTLTGVGGVGKTRLAYRVADEVRRTFRDGVWVVELAPVQDGELVAQTVATAMGLIEWTFRSPLDVLVDFLADKYLLLVLDNCEHLQDPCARLVEKVLKAAAGVRVLATSRQPLRAPGEYVLDVPPLSVPPREAAGNISEFEAIRLFADRATASVTDFAVTEDNRQTVARLCQRLDGIPLAIELAAARLRELSVADILDRLGDRFHLLTRGNRTAMPRQQTLRAAIGWSYELCSIQEQTLWRRLSVFPGGCELEAVEEVCSGETIRREDVLDLVAALVDKSILLSRDHDAGAVRYQLLETIRQYGHELLIASGEQTTLRRRHRDYYQRLARQAEAQMFGPRQLQWLVRMQQEHVNLQAALDFCESEPGQDHAGLEIAALRFYWLYTGLNREGRRRLDRVLAQDIRPSPARAKALWVNALLAAVVATQAGAEVPLLEECRTLGEKLDDPASLAAAVHISGWAAYTQRDFPRAVTLLEETLARYRDVDADLGMIWLALFNLVFAATPFALSKARTAATECLAMAENAGARWSIGCALGANARVAWTAGETGQAIVLARKAIRTVRDLWSFPISVELLARAATAEGQYRYAAILRGCKNRLQPEDSCPSPTGATQHSEAQLRQALGEEEFAAAFRQGANLSVEEAIAYALDEKQATAPATSSTMSTQLTPRERQVAELVAQGLSNKAIAAALVISQRTAEGHIEHILSKLGFTSRTQIATWILHS